jgi:four helix bundle protein
MPRDASKLHVFRTADRLALAMYTATRTLPRSEQFELGKQLRRAALSVPTNLVEGGQRDSTREYRRFVGIALGSAAETRYLLTVAYRLGILPEAGSLISDYEALVRGLQKLHTSLAELPDERNRAPTGSP